MNVENIVVYFCLVKANMYFIETEIRVLLTPIFPMNIAFQLFKVWFLSLTQTLPILIILLITFCHLYLYSSPRELCS